MASNYIFSAAAKRLEGKVALITGGLGGIGSITAKLFTDHGAKVLIADIKDQNLSQENTSFIHCDVTNESHIEKAVDKAVSIYGKLDIMFNNAGILDSPTPDILDYKKVEFERVLHVNLIGAFLGTKHAARVMKPVRHGTIINTASVASVIGGASNHAYTCSKHAILGLTRNTAVELGQFGIRVNSVSPYACPTPMSRGFLNRSEDDMLDDVYSNLKGVAMKPEDVAWGVLYLASDESRCVSGHNLILDGGFTVLNVAMTMFD